MEKPPLIKEINKKDLDRFLIRNQRKDILTKILTIVSLVLLFIAFTVGSCYERNYNIDKEIAQVDILISDLRYSFTTANDILKQQGGFQKGKDVPAIRFSTNVISTIIPSGLIRDEYLADALLDHERMFISANRMLDFAVDLMPNESLVAGTMQKVLLRMGEFDKGIPPLIDRLEIYKKELNESRPLYCIELKPKG